MPVDDSCHRRSRSTASCDRCLERFQSETGISLPEQVACLNEPRTCRHELRNRMDLLEVPPHRRRGEHAEGGCRTRLDPGVELDRLNGLALRRDDYDDAVEDILGQSLEALSVPADHFELDVLPPDPAARSRGVDQDYGRGGARPDRANAARPASRLIQGSTTWNRSTLEREAPPRDHAGGVHSLPSSRSATRRLMGSMVYDWRRLPGRRDDRRRPPYRGPARLQGRHPLNPAPIDDRGRIRALGDVRATLRATDTGGRPAWPFDGWAGSSTLRGPRRGRGRQLGYRARRGRLNLAR